MLTERGQGILQAWVKCKKPEICKRALAMNIEGAHGKGKASKKNQRHPPKHSLQDRGDSKGCKVRTQLTTAPQDLWPQAA